MAQDSQLAKLVPGDSVSIQVYGQPDMSGTVYVGDDGTINVPLAGTVRVRGMTPVEAGVAVDKALRDGRFLVDPHVTLTVQQTQSRQVSVLGEVRTPGRYALATGSTVFDVLALAGGITENAGYLVRISRQDAEGQMKEFELSLRRKDGINLSQVADQNLQSGDRIYVPRAEQFYIHGEVRTPNAYRVEPGMTIQEAIARAGGITDRGSLRRIDVTRTGPDGKKSTERVKRNDPVLRMTSS